MSIVILRALGGYHLALIIDLQEPLSMANALPNCPQCDESFTYEQDSLLVCPMCGHEWSADPETSESESVIRDAVGNPLADGDDVTVVRDLKVKGSGSGTVKIGTKVRAIRLIADGVDDHDIDANVPGFGRMQLKSSVVKKA